MVLSSELKLWDQKHTGYESAEDHMLRVFEQLSSHQLLNLSVEELSQKFGCSRRHLSRLFHQRFGLSVATLRMEMRLLKASSLLRDPGVKVINVAEQCGFNHLGLFNTCFKRRFGMTPGLWRNMQNSNTPAGKASRVVDTCPLQVNGLCPWNDKPEGSGARQAAPVQSQKPVGSKTSVGNTDDLKKRPLMQAKAVEKRSPSFPSLTHPRPIDGQQVA